MALRKMIWLAAFLAAASAPQFVDAESQALTGLTRLTLSPGGAALVSDYRNQRILVMDGNPLQPKDQIATNGRPLGVALVQDRLYVGNDTTSAIDVYELHKNGKWKLVVSKESKKSRGEAAPEEGLVPKPTDMAVDETQGLLFVVSVEKSSILVFDIHDDIRGEFVRTIGAGDLRIPIGIALDQDLGHVLVSDMGDPHGDILDGPNVSASIEILDYLGNHLATISGTGDEGFEFSRPQGLAVDSSGHIYLVDSFLGQVLVFDGTSLMGEQVLGSKGTEPGQLMHPLDVEIDASTGNVLVTSRMTGRVEIFEGGAAP